MVIRVSNAYEHIIKSLDAGVRLDGRKADEYRKITIETGVSKNAEGSAKVTIGDSEILAGVKMAVEQPYPDTQEQGNLMVNAELTAMSNPNFEAGPPGQDAIEIARIVDRGIRETKYIDTNKLCITPKEEVWSVMIDVVTINTDGNLIDISSLAAAAAVKDTKMPKYEDKVVKYDELTNNSLPLDLKKLPVTVTVFKIGKHLIVDPLPEEEAVADARLSAAIVEDGSIFALQKGSDHPITPKDVDDMLELAQTKAGELRKML